MPEKTLHAWHAHDAGWRYIKIIKKLKKLDPLEGQEGDVGRGGGGGTEVGMSLAKCFFN